MPKTIYNKRYAEAWIQNAESGKDIYREKYLKPFVKIKLQKLPAGSTVLDVGCGWGAFIPFLKRSHAYCGIDIAKYFLTYIRRKYKSRNIHLKYGFLPDSLPVPDNHSDFTLCSLVLHAVNNILISIDALFSKTKKNGQVLIIGLRDSAEEFYRTEVFIQKYEEDKKHVRGVALLPSGVEIFSETFFHKEKQIEAIIKRHGTFTKRFVGPLFVAYEAVKK